MKHARGAVVSVQRQIANQLRFLTVGLGAVLVLVVAVMLPATASDRWDNPFMPLELPSTEVRVTVIPGSDFTPTESEAKGAYVGVLLDEGAVTRYEPQTNPDTGGPLARDDFYAVGRVSPDGDFAVSVDLPNGTNNPQRASWYDGDVHKLTIYVYYTGDALQSKTVHYLRIVKAPDPGPTAEPEPSEAPTTPAPTAPQPTATPTTPAPTTSAPAPTQEPTTDPQSHATTASPRPQSPAPDPVPSSEPQPEPSTQTPDPYTPPQEPTSEKPPVPSEPSHAPVAPDPTPSTAGPAQSDGSADPDPTPSATSNTVKPDGEPVLPVASESDLTDANTGGVSASFASGKVTVNVPSDKAPAGDWVSANILPGRQAQWLQVSDDNQASMDLPSLPNGEYKIVIATRDHTLVGWAQFKVATTSASGAGDGAAVDTSASMNAHAQMLENSLRTDAADGLNGYLLGAGACMLILGGLVVLQVMSGPTLRGMRKSGS